MSADIKTCPRCRKPLKGKTANFLDRLYHEVCYVVILVHYKSFPPDYFKGMTLDEIHNFLYYSQTYYTDLD